MLHLKLESENEFVATQRSPQSVRLRMELQHEVAVENDLVLLLGRFRSLLDCKRRGKNATGGGRKERHTHRYHGFDDRRSRSLPRFNSRHQQCS